MNYELRTTDYGLQTADYPRKIPPPPSYRLLKSKNMKTLLKKERKSRLTAYLALGQKAVTVTLEGCTTSMIARGRIA
jgi:hypothetical protein